MVRGKVLGADKAVDYTKQKFEEIYKDAPFDCVVDLIGGGHCPRMQLSEQTRNHWLTGNAAFNPAHCCNV